MALMPNDPSLSRILEEMGVETTDTNVQELRVLLDCFNIFIERSGQYEDLWKEDGYFGNLFHMRHKMARLWKQFWQSETGSIEDLDNAFDLIVYTTFFIRNVVDKNSRGKML